MKYNVVGWSDGKPTILESFNGATARGTARHWAKSYASSEDAGGYDCIAVQSSVAVGGYSETVWEREQ
jgi:hypothetical protein